MITLREVLDLGFTYFIAADTRDGGVYIKIGYSSNPKRRFRVLQNKYWRSGCRYPNGIDLSTLRLVGMIQGGRLTERALHRRFKHLQPIGEWYLPVDELTRYIESLDLIPELPTAIEDLPDDMWSYKWL